MSSAFAAEEMQTSQTGDGLMGDNPSNQRHSFLLQNNDCLSSGSSVLYPLPGPCLAIAVVSHLRGCKR